jgi:NADPH:quinone reductase-like Zn-dependent oxidoreductase
VKAIVQDTYGSTDVLELRHIDKPEIGDSEVLVRVHAGRGGSGRLASDSGFALPDTPRGLRAAGAQDPRCRSGPSWRGRGRRQERDQIPARRRGLRHRQGSYAEFAGAREDKLAPMPANLSFEQAAVVAISGLPALQGLRAAGSCAHGNKC